MAVVSVTEAAREAAVWTATPSSHPHASIAHDLAESYVASCVADMTAPRATSTGAPRHSAPTPSRASARRSAKPSPPRTCASRVAWKSGAAAT